jgi:hypothetical protein
MPRAKKLALSAVFTSFGAVPDKKGRAMIPPFRADIAGV